MGEWSDERGESHDLHLHSQGVEHLEKERVDGRGGSVVVPGGRDKHAVVDAVPGAVVTQVAVCMRVVAGIRQSFDGLVQVLIQPVYVLGKLGAAHHIRVLRRRGCGGGGGAER